MNRPDAPFAEPWQARAFALVVQLHASGRFTWAEWSEALGREIARGGDYWPAWLRALEVFVATEAPPAELAATAERWRRAAHATPHGLPVALDNAPD